MRYLIDVRNGPSSTPGLRQISQFYIWPLEAFIFAPLHMLLSHNIQIAAAASATSTAIITLNKNSENCSWYPSTTSCTQSFTAPLSLRPTTRSIGPAPRSSSQFGQRLRAMSLLKKCVVASLAATAVYAVSIRLSYGARTVSVRKCLS